MTESPPRHSLHWDIFCRVIDNFGDAGVCWRLARQLVREQGQKVQLWIDELEVLAQLVPDLDTSAKCQFAEGICVRHWQTHSTYQPDADVVIEAFGCTLPATYLSAINQPPLWLNLEYLSAESWVEGCHLLPSPVDGRVKKFFFFPGFTEQTGGLLRENGLLDERDAFQKSATAQTRFLQRFGVEPASGSLLISLFCYENPALASWLSALAEHPTPVHLLIPEGRVQDDIIHWLSLPTIKRGDHIQRGQCHLHILSFLSPDDYDRLLWCCDLNVVRGEDSFVRAQWAEKPFVWHIYPQQDRVHLDKLDAFLTLYNQCLDPDAAQAVSAFWHNWNEGQNLLSSWRNLLSRWPAIEAGTRAWSGRLSAQKNISQQLVTFAQKQLIFAPRNVS